MTVLVDASFGREIVYNHFDSPANTITYVHDLQNSKFLCVPVASVLGWGLEGETTHRCAMKRIEKRGSRLINFTRLLAPSFGEMYTPSDHTALLLANINLI
jgi:hypothetical protein